MNVGSPRLTDIHIVPYYNKRGENMDISLGVLSDYASVSQEGKLNIMGVFGEINPPMLPFALPIMYLVLTFEASPAEVDSDKTLKVALLDADGHQIFAMEQPMKVPQPKRPGSVVLMNAVMALAGIRFEKAGDYAFSILIGGDEKRRVALHINEPIKGGQ